MEIWVATGNSHKLAEIKTLLSAHPFTVHSQSELDTFYQPPETGKTFLDNARIKARALHAVIPDKWVMAEDSGIVAEGLNGSPGIFSARYAGENASDIENNLKLLQMLKIRSPGNRNASFICSMVIKKPGGEEFNFEGVLKGKVIEVPRGQSGFGYDPLFIPEGETKTMSELGPAIKNKISHRGQAVRSALSVLQTAL